MNNETEKSKKKGKGKDVQLEGMDDPYLEPEFAETPEKNKRIMQKIEQAAAEGQNEAQKSKEGILK